MSDQLVPEGFDLEAARNARSTTPSKERKRCPHCQSLNVQIKVRKPWSARRYEENHYCQNCGTHFDDPIRGEASD